MTINQILAELEAAGGAILHWQANSSLDWQSALDNGQIKFDADFDLYVHPRAVSNGDGSYTMN